MNSNTKKYIVWGVVALVVVILGYWYWAKQNAAKTETEAGK